jgi:hypothetical protein
VDHRPNPTSNLWVTFQRDTAATGSASSWRVRISISNPNAGAPAATVVASVTTAADEQVILGGGSDAVPTFTQWFEGVQNTMRQQISVMDRAVFGLHDHVEKTRARTTT